jgi:hypothetical protein
VAQMSEFRAQCGAACLANQHLEQIALNVRAAVLGSAGTLIVFRVSSNDAEILAPEFHPRPAHELSGQWPMGLGCGASTPINGPSTWSPSLFPSRNRRQKVIGQSQRNFGRPRSIASG